MTVLEAATALRVSRATVYRLIHRGELAKTKVGRRTRITAQSFAAYVAANTSKDAA